MKTVFLLLLLLSTGGCAAKQWPPLSPPLFRRIPEGPRTRDSPMLASRVLLERPGRCPGHGRQGGDVHFGTRATGIDEAWIAAVPKD